MKGRSQRAIFLRQALMLFLVFSLMPSMPMNTAQPSASDDATSRFTGDYSGYHFYDEYLGLINTLAVQHPDIMQVQSIGLTYEGREITAVKISDNPELREMDEPQVLLMGAHHSNEQIAYEVLIYFIDMIVNNYTHDTRITWLVDNREIWVVPLVNPDGLVYMENTADNWRKNRQPWRGETLVGDNVKPYGVDLNRNYGYKWGYPNVATTQNPYSSTYRGPSPFSERETIAIKNLAETNNFVFSMSYHSYSELILYPWGYTPMDTAEEDLFIKIGQRMVEYTNYTLTQAADLYPASGDSDDFLYGELGIYAFTIELGTEYAPPAEYFFEDFFIPQSNMLLFLSEAADNPHLDSPVIRYNHTKDLCNAFEAYSIELDVQSEVGIADGGMQVHYSTDGERFESVTMEKVGDISYRVNIPKQKGGTVVQYYIEATDLHGHSSLAKKYAPLEYHEYQVDVDIGLSAFDTALMYFMIFLIFGIIWGGFYKSIRIALASEKKKKLEVDT
jgi:hypothetical protein